MSENANHIKVKVFPEASEDLLEETDSDSFIAYVRASATAGAANQAVITLLRKKFKGKNVKIVSGHQKRHKIVAVL